MSDENEAVVIDLKTIAEELEHVVQSDRPGPVFWQTLLASYCRLCHACQGLILVKRKGATSWQPAAEQLPSTDNGKPAPPVLPRSRWHALAQETASLAAETSGATLPAGSNGHLLTGVRLRLLAQEDTCVAVFLLHQASPEALQQTLGRLHLTAAAPRTYQLQQAIRSAQADAENFAKVFDLMTMVNAESRFLAAAMAFCNGVANAWNCERVSLGWHEHGYARLKAISRTEKFDRQMAEGQCLEAAMDETLDQHEAILWPPPPEQSVIARDHEKLSKTVNGNSLLSLPLRDQDEEQPHAILLCERPDNRPFTLAEARQLGLACDLASPRLNRLHASDRWFGARSATRVRTAASRLLGPDHTWTKILALGFVFLLAILILVKPNYRVEGDFLLRSDQLAYLTAPFDGFIDEVHREVGDTVSQGDLLLSLQTDELLLQEAAELADVASYARESERARAANRLADMRIAEARQQQAEARLAIVRHRLAQAEIRAPFDGILIEGDLRELRGKPIQQGNSLFKIAQLKDMVAEVDIDERDIHEVLESTDAELAFVGRPQVKFPVTISRLETAAFSNEDKNVFQMHVRPSENPEPWWRPGMTGVCKVNVGPRPLWWILGHRTADFLRLWLWW